MPLHVYAGIDVKGTLDGRAPDEINAPFPTLEFVFHNVTPGPHTVEIRDVVGFDKTVVIVVPRPTSTSGPTKGPMADGACVPAAPLGVSV